MRKGLRITSVLLAFLVVLSQLIQPIAVEGLGLKDEQEVVLFQVQADLEVADFLTIKENTYVYGVKQGEGVDIQFADSEFTIPAEALEEVVQTEVSPVYYEEAAQRAKETATIEENVAASEQSVLPQIENLEPLSNKLVKGAQTNRNYSKYFRATSDAIIYDNRVNPIRPIGKLTKGQVYPRVSDYGNWHRIQFGKIYGYVSKSSTEPSDGTNIRNETKSTQFGTRSFTTNSDVYVYDNSSGKNVPFGVIQKGVSFPITADYGNWWRVTFSDRIGYVNKSHVETEFTTGDRYFRANANLPVYDNRSGKLRQIGRLEQGQAYPRVSDYGNYHRIQFDDYYGYVRKSSTSLHSGIGINNVFQGKLNKYKTGVATATMPVYDTSSGKNVKFAEINAGETYTIHADYGNWWRVIYAGRVGYVHKANLQESIARPGQYFRVTGHDAYVKPLIWGNTDVRLAKLLPGQVYPILEDYDQTWYRVQYGDSSGFVRKSRTTPADGSQVFNLSQQHKNSSRTFVAKNNVTVYDNSTGALVPFGEIKRGQMYPIASDHGSWWQIIYLDRVGYVSKNDVQISEEPNVNQVVQSYRNKNTAEKIENISQFFVGPSANYRTAADQMLNGRYQIGSRTFNYGNTILWNRSPVGGETLSRTHYRDLHAHFFINDLVAAYHETGNKNYLVTGYQAIDQWMRNNTFEKPSQELAWHAETAARRLVVWVNFYDAAKDVLNNNQLTRLLDGMIEHANYHVSDAYHITGENHGMFQDDALLVFSEYFDQLPKADLYNRTARDRLRAYFDQYISKDGVHLEHSPEYHQVIARSVRNYRDYFNGNDQQAYEYYRDKYASMGDYFAWVIKPDGTVPLLGDTFSTLRPLYEHWQDNEAYKYSRTGGAQGTMPTVHSKVFADAGYAIFRDDWSKGRDATYINFTASYHSGSHKHADDLSVWIYANGRDLVREAGPNGYEYENPYTEYAYSSYAHNTLVVNKESLPRNDDKYQSTYLKPGAVVGGNVSRATGVNKRYPGVTHEREVAYNRTTKKITIADQMTANKTNNYQLLWNLAEGVTPVVKNKQTIELHANGQKQMTLRINSQSNYNVRIAKGETNPHIGWQIPTRGNAIPTSTIVIEADGANVTIQSEFTIE